MPNQIPPSQSYFRDCLRRELAARLDRNPRYSLRAFARSLDVPASTLSRALAGKRSISLEAAQRIAAALDLAPKEKAHFLDSLSETPTRRGASRATEVSEVDEETFRVIADWQHYAILELTYLKAFRPEAGWIAKRLGISEMEASLALDRLLRLGLLRWEGRKLKKTRRTLWKSPDGDAASQPMRRYQQQCLAKATDALDTIPFGKRTASAMTMPIDPAKLPLVRRMIEEFALEVCRTAAAGNMTDVYQLTIHFHSLLKGENT